MSDVSKQGLEVLARGFFHALPEEDDYEFHDEKFITGPCDGCVSAVVVSSAALLDELERHDAKVAALEKENSNLRFQCGGMQMTIDKLHTELAAFRHHEEFGLFCANCGKPIGANDRFVTGSGIDHEEVCCSQFCHDEHERLGCPQGEANSGFRDAAWYGSRLRRVEAELAALKGAAGTGHLPDEVFVDEFNAWWESDGQYVRTGGGNYEWSFAFEAWRHLYPRIVAAMARDAEGLVSIVASVAAESEHILALAKGPCRCSRCCLIREAREVLAAHRAGKDGKV